MELEWDKTLGTRVGYTSVSVQCRAASGMTFFLLLTHPIYDFRHSFSCSLPGPTSDPGSHGTPPPPHYVACEVYRRIHDYGHA